jgi:hypothetical protein
MSGTTREPAKNPCGTCPYRQDVPSGVWAAPEYAKLPEYDKPTGEQPMGLFHCHQQDGRLCAGWVAVHDMDHALAIRMAQSMHWLSPDVIDAVLDYDTDVPLWASGQEAAEHGLAEIEEISWEARRKIDRLLQKGVARRAD